MLDDGTGQCLIDPRGAEVFPGATDVWYGPSEWPQVRIPERHRGVRLAGRHCSSTDKYRYTEYRLQPNQEPSTPSAHSAASAASASRARKARWRNCCARGNKTQAALLARFDSNHDGASERRGVGPGARSRPPAGSRRPAWRTPRPPSLNVLANPADGRAFLLAASDGETLARKFRRRSAGRPRRVSWAARPPSPGCCCTSDRIRTVNNPLLELESLPAFGRIEASHARPALEKVLAENRARLAELTAQARPDLRLAGRPGRGAELPVEPRLEPDRPFERGRELGADARGVQRMRAAADRVFLGTRAERRACRPAMPTCCSMRAPRSIRRSARWWRTRCAIFAWPESICRPTKRPATAKSRSGSRSWPPSFPRMCSMPGAPIRAASPTARNLPGLPANAIDRAAADAREANQPGWLFKLDQPTYMTIMASAESEQLRRDIYEAWVTRASELGPERRAVRQQSHHCRNPAAASRAGRACWVSRTLPTTPWPRAWRRAASRCSAFWTTWRGAACPRRARSSRISKNSRAASSTPGTWRSTANGCRKAASRSRRRRCGPIFRCPRCCPACSR